MNLDTRIILFLILYTYLIFLMVYIIKKIKVWIKTKREINQRRKEGRKEIIRKLKELKTEKTKPSISKKEELTQSTEKDKLSSKERYEKYLESILSLISALPLLQIVRFPPRPYMSKTGRSCNGYKSRLIQYFLYRALLPGAANN